MRAAVLILNLNSWKDTLECLECVFRSDHPIQTVVLCDNGSTDGSVERVIDWAEGRLDVCVPVDSPLRELSFPPLPKPIALQVLSREEAESGTAPLPTGSPTLVVIRNGDNLGFAGGNNVGLRYLLTRDDWDCVWVLNPDTAVRKDALGHLCEGLKTDERVGMCGATVLYYWAPDTVQALGGATYNKWLALPHHIGTGRPASEAIDVDAVLREMRYVYGASMLVSREFLETVGLMNEERFLYFEELDWAIRGEGSFQLAYAPESIVYHREGGTVGAGRGKSWTSDYYFLRNRIRVTRDFAAYALPTVYFAILVAALRRLSRGQWDRALMAAKLLWTA